MPNIEMHGFLELKEGTRIYIRSIFNDWSCKKDMVITLFDSDVRDSDDESQPFLRVWDADAKEGEKIAMHLRLEGFDVELAPPIKFFAKPLYNLSEIKDEIRSLLRLENRNTFEELLLAGDYPSIIDIFTCELAAMPYCNLTPPSSEEMSQRFEAPKYHDYSEKACRARLVRWNQMLNILRGK